MKKLMVLVFVFMSIFGWCQSTDTLRKIDYCSLKFERDEDVFVINDVVAIDSSTSNQLFNRAKLWVADNFKTPKSVIQDENKDLGYIIIKGNSDLSVTANYYFKIKAEFKDGKYRLQFRDISVKIKNDARLADSDLTDFRKTVEIPIEMVFKDNRRLKAIDDILRCLIMKDIHKMKSSFLKKLMKKDDW